MSKEIDQYIELILQSVLNTDLHEDISSEIYDHIQSLVEEKIEQGMEENDAIRKSILSMGEPKELSARFNEIYHMNKSLLIIIAIVNAFFIVLLSNFILNISAYQIIDYVDFILITTSTIYSIFYCIKFVFTLNNVSKDTIYYSQQNDAKTKSYIENLTDKIFIVGGSLFFLSYFFIIFLFIIEVGINEFFINSSHTLSLITMYLNGFFMIIINKKYPPLIISKHGLYIFTYIPKLIAWNNFKYNKWIKTSNRNILELSNYQKTKKVYGNFTDSDKIIIDNIIKYQQKQN
ncbi:MAG: permease prefix domain 1-containing protein [Eubacteriaceae bacterium]